MGSKSPSELNTRHIRVSLDDYTAIDDLSQSSGVTRAEALHSLLEKQGKETQGYTVTIRTRGGSTILVDCSPKMLPEIVKLVQGIEFAEIRVLSSGTESAPQEPAAQGKELKVRDSEPEPRRSRFVTLF